MSTIGISAADLDMLQALLLASENSDTVDGLVARPVSHTQELPGDDQVTHKRKKQSHNSLKKSSVAREFKKKHTPSEPGAIVEALVDASQRGTSASTLLQQKRDQLLGTNSDEHRMHDVVMRDMGEDFEQTNAELSLLSTTANTTTTTTARHNRPLVANPLQQPPVASQHVAPAGDGNTAIVNISIHHSVTNQLAQRNGGVDSASDSETEHARSLETAELAKQTMKQHKIKRRRKSRQDSVPIIRAVDPDSALVASLNDHIAPPPPSSQAPPLPTHETQPPVQRYQDPVAAQSETLMPVPANGTTVRAIYKLDDDEEARLKHYKSLHQLDSLEALGIGLQNIDFKMTDMNWLFQQTALNTGARAWIPKERMEFINRVRAAAVTVTRAEEDSYLRIPKKGANERECVYMERCEGHKGFPIPVTLVEFLDVRDREYVAKNNGALPAAVRPCVMCRRFLVQYIDTNLRNEARATHAALSLTYQNIADRAGEYSSSQMLKTSVDENQAVLGFVVRHVRRYYRQYTDSAGVVWFEQSGYLQVPANMTSTAADGVEQSFFL
jgi:hypothetical protein